MDLISLAVPFFLLAIVGEWLLDRRRGSTYMPFQDALGSLMAGALSNTTGLFSKLITIAIYAWTIEHAALLEMPHHWFDVSLSGVLCWLCVLLVWDFFYYWKHRLGHEVSFFWAAHSVHHQSEEYNLTTALRQTSTDFLVGWIVYLPLFLFGVPLFVFVTVSAIDLIYQFWVHTRHIDKLGWADSVFVTPSNHRVHHAQNTRYIDKNYGGILIVWDRLFGTFEPERDDDPVVFGVRKPLASFNPFVANFQVYRYLWFDMMGTQRWSDKLRLWFARTGWRPDDVARAFPTPARRLSDFKKHAPRLHRSLRRYLALQFIVVVTATLAISVLAGRLDGPSLVALCGLLWAMLATMGLLCDAHSHAREFEYLRLLAVMPVSYWVANRVPAADVSTILGAATLYAAASLVLFFVVGRQSAPDVRAG